MAFRSMYFAIKCEAEVNPDLEQWERLGGYSRKNPIKGDDKVARKAVKEVLENRDFSTDELLKLLTNEYWYDLHKENPDADPDTILCSALADFFWQYKNEFGVNIQRTEGKRTLCKPLQELYSFLKDSVFPRGPPEYRNRKQGILKGSNQSVEAILEAVRLFLITKADEGSPANTVTPGPEKLQPQSRHQQLASHYRKTSKPPRLPRPSRTRIIAQITSQQHYQKHTLMPKTTLQTSLSPKLPDKDKIGAPEAFTTTKTHSEVQNTPTRASITYTSELAVTARTGKDDLKKGTPIQPSLKRKRDESSPNFLASLRRNAKVVKLLWRAHNDEMEKLELIETDREDEGQEIQALRARVQQLEERLKSNQISQKDVIHANAEKSIAQGEAQRALFHNRLLEASERELRQERDDTKKELGAVQRELDASKREIDRVNRKACRIKKKAKIADRERVGFGKELKAAINLKNGMKKMLIVAGPNLCFGSTFTSEIIDAAAEAVVEGKGAKIAVTDMIRAAMC